jgi:hypothetical protein
MTDDNTLLQLSELDRILAQATKIDTVTDIRDKVKALEAYAKTIHASTEEINQFVMARLKAERKAGQILAEQLHRGGNGNNQYQKEQRSTTSTLADLGISKYHAGRWQAIASIPDDVFEQELAHLIERNVELSTSHFFTLANRLAGKTYHRPEWIELQYTGGHAVVLPGVNRGQTVVIKYAIVEVIEQENTYGD